jgi:hypothetical protein
MATIEELSTETLELSIPLKKSIFQTISEILNRNKPRKGADKMAEDRNSTFDRVDAACKALFVERDAKYGHATVETGVQGAVVELVGITARLKQMVLRSADHGASQVEDLAQILKDAHNYANIALMEMADDNWIGR